MNNADRIAAEQLMIFYPISALLTEEHLDADTSLIKPSANINACIVGFSASGRELLLTSVANNQFVTADVDGNVVCKTVSYHIFDERGEGASEDISDSLGRIYRFVENAEKSDYLPMPELPAEIFWHTLEGAQSVLSEISLNTSDLNVVYVDLGNDVDNSNLSFAICRLAEERGIEGLNVFVRQRGMDINLPDSCIPYGSLLSSPLYEKITELSVLRSLADYMERHPNNPKTKLTESEYYEHALQVCKERWVSNTNTLKRESNRYGILSIRSKLRLMGLDACPVGTEGVAPLSEDEYFSIYASFDMPRFSSILPDGKRVVEYPVDFPSSRRNTLAIQEHLRWNAFMLTRGFLPATVDEILHSTTDGKYTNGRCFDKRVHGNLTTWQGLLDYRRIVAERDRSSECITDVMKYDYQLLDDAFWLLGRVGYSIYKAKGQKQ